ncbi:HP1 family phage holin [Testudinibacter sp. P27/CKL/0425]
MYRTPENASYWGALIATISGYSINEWAAVFGILFGFSTLLINMYYKRKEFQLKLQEHHLKLNEKNSHEQE